MKIKVFRSNKGDCLLLESKDNKHVLVDGGMKGSFEEHVAEELSKLETLDLVCVSHIDVDHINGILFLIGSLKDWRVFQIQQEHAEALNITPTRPKSPKPPQIKEFWHNAFKVQIDDPNREVEALVQAIAALSSEFNPDDHSSLNERQLATGVAQGIELSNLLDLERLNIALNKPSKGALMVADELDEDIRIGDFKINIIGPAQSTIDDLQKEWKVWVKNNKERVRRLEEKALQDKENLDQSFNDVLDLLLTKGVKIGDRDAVTTPNLASIMFYIKEGEVDALMTGDGHSQDIIEGLEAKGIKEPGKGMHVKVLKVQHHGSEFNLDKQFCKDITADHYIFCGNGAHHNPDTDILKIIYNSRQGIDEDLSENSEVDQPFTFWFSCNNEIADITATQSEQMEKVRKLMEEFQNNSPDKFSFEFMPKENHFLEIEL